MNLKLQHLIPTILNIINRKKLIYLEIIIALMLINFQLKVT